LSIAIISILLKKKQKKILNNGFFAEYLVKKEKNNIKVSQSYSGSGLILLDNILNK
jgi:hypothetical protein